METNPNKVDVETSDLTRAEWLEKFIMTSKEVKLLKVSSDNNESVNLEDNAIVIINHHPNFDDSDASSDHYDDDYHMRKRKERELLYDLRMTRMAPLFASQPRLEKICKDRGNMFLKRCFTEYIFIDEYDSIDEYHENANDLEYIINLCGTNLTYLDVSGYHTSQIMPIINANCPNLEELHLRFKEISIQDFENVFSNMSHLKFLEIQWDCKNSTLPTTLTKSLEQISETLINLELQSDVCEPHVQFLPDSLASVFPRLIILEYLYLEGFGVSQQLLQSIAEIKSLIDLRLTFFLPENHPMFDPRMNTYPLGKLKNLEKLFLSSNYGIRDEFLINLCNNAEKLKVLQIVGKDITDIGMSAIDNLRQLENFEMGLFSKDPNPTINEYITDESIQCLYNQKLLSLDLSNCINITDKGVIKLVQNLPNLRSLLVHNTKVSCEVAAEIWNLTDSVRVLNHRSNKIN